MDSNYELEYNVGHWSKRFKTAEEVRTYYVNFITEASNRARSEIPYETVSYGEGSSETIDIFGTNLPKDAPIFVYVHGGYWKAMSKNNSAHSVEQLYNAKCKVFIVDYSLCPTVTLEELVSQITKCYKFVLDYASNSSTKHISFVGHSAGAHLTICGINKLLSEKLPSADNLLPIKNIYLISGVYDLNDLRHTTVNKDNILSLTDENVNQLSPLKFDYSSWNQLILNVKIYVYVAENDSKTFINHSKQLHEQLNEKYKLNSEYFLINECDHFDIVENLTKDTFQITKEIVKNISIF